MQIKVHDLVACGGDDGAVECFDTRVRSSVGRINAVVPACDTDQEVTAIEFDGEGGYFMAVGSSAGKPPESTYDLMIKDDLESSQALSCLQIETLVYACQRHVQHLPDGAKAVFLSEMELVWAKDEQLQG